MIAAVSIALAALTATQLTPPAWPRAAHYAGNTTLETVVLGVAAPSISGPAEYWSLCDVAQPNHAQWRVVRNTSVSVSGEDLDAVLSTAEVAYCNPTAGAAGAIYTGLSIPYLPTVCTALAVQHDQCELCGTCSDTLHRLTDTLFRDL